MMSTDSLPHSVINMALQNPNMTVHDRKDRLSVAGTWYVMKPCYLHGTCIIYLAFFMHVCNLHVSQMWGFLLLILKSQYLQQSTEAGEDTCTEWFQHPVCFLNGTSPTMINPPRCYFMLQGR